MWAINSKIVPTIKLMDEWGYDVIDEIQWVKQTVNGKIAKGNAHYLQHSKESCLVGKKGNPVYIETNNPDVIISK